MEYTRQHLAAVTRRLNWYEEFIAGKKDMKGCNICASVNHLCYRCILNIPTDNDYDKRHCRMNRSRLDMLTYYNRGYIDIARHAAAERYEQILEILKEKGYEYK